MIRYNYSEDDIKDAIKIISSTWLNRAADKTAKLIAKEGIETNNIWSEIKPVYVALQQNKCIFCERKFESLDYGKIEFDLEHFRPKSSVKAWPPTHSQFQYDFRTGSGSKKGYDWLAYDVLNYAASCKVCNSTLKSSYFPIAGSRKRAGRPKHLLAEKPFLCYPIGDWDSNPEDLITFTATTAIPAKQGGHDRRRGEIIIDFFSLNRRQELHEQRAQMIIILGNALRDLERREDVIINEAIVTRVLTNEIPHSACLRAYRRLWEDNKHFAEEVLIVCKGFYSRLIELDSLVALSD